MLLTYTSLPITRSKKHPSWHHQPQWFVWPLPRPSPVTLSSSIMGSGQSQAPPSHEFSFHSLEKLQPTSSSSFSLPICTPVLWHTSKLWAKLYRHCLSHRKRIHNSSSLGTSNHQCLLVQSLPCLLYPHPLSHPGEQTKWGTNPILQQQTSPKLCLVAAALCIFHRVVTLRQQAGCPIGICQASPSPTQFQ